MEERQIRKCYWGNTLFHKMNTNSTLTLRRTFLQLGVTAVSVVMLTSLWNKSKNFFSSQSTSHIVHIRTGDRRGAGTDANVRILLKDEEKNSSGDLKLSHWYSNDHERNKTSVFAFRGLTHLGTVNEIELWRDKFGVGDAWYVDYVEVEHVALDGKKHIFPIHRWLEAHVRYSIRQYDAYLPQNSHIPEERKQELEKKRRVYEYKRNVPGGPAQIKNLPSDEMFSGKYTFEMLSIKSVTLITSRIIGLLSDWNTINDVKKLYRSKLADLFKKAELRREEPYTLDNWDKDEWFGLQRIQGCNPILLKLCKEIPEKFGVTNDMIKPFLEGRSIEEAIAAKRLFIIDLKILEGLPHMPETVICTPLALFYLNNEKILKPIAIQLFQQKGPDNPVFLPTDPEYTWLLAKMYYNNADAIFHQAYTHLGFTHLIMEGVVVCTHRNLSPSHPLFRLLAPHFLYLLAINTRGLEKLVSEGGWVDRTMSCGRNGMFELIKRGLDIWRLDLHGTIPKEIASREVIDPEVLPYYPYRDDAIAIFNVIRNYVSEIVNHYYKSDDDVKNDYELQNWRKEMVLDRDSEGVGLLGVPGDENGFNTIEQVIDTVTAIISVCSIGHAAANFQQYDEYAFSPNYPASLLGEPPKDKTELTESDILKYLPKKEIILDIMVITTILSNKGTKSLSDFEVQYLYDPVAIEAAKRFHEELKKLSAKIKERNQGKNAGTYSWLDPDDIPNAISI